MICKHCKKRIPDDSIICPKCKKPVIELNKEDKGPDRRSIALVMTGAVIAVFCLMASMPFIIGKREKPPADNTEILTHTADPDNSRVIEPSDKPAESGEPAVSGEPAEEVTPEPEESAEPAEQVTIAPIESIETIAPAPAYEEVTPTFEPIETIAPMPAFEETVRTERPQTPKPKSTPEPTPEPTPAPTDNPPETTVSDTSHDIIITNGRIVDFEISNFSSNSGKESDFEAPESKRKPVQ